MPLDHSLLPVCVCMWAVASWIESCNFLLTQHISNKYWTRPLTHWGRVTHICVGKLIIIGSDNGLSPGRRQAIIWTNAAWIWSIGPLGINFSEILIEIHTFSFLKIHLKMSSGKWRPFCLGLNDISDMGTRLNRQPLFCRWQTWPRGQYSGYLYTSVTNN